MLAILSLVSLVVGAFAAGAGAFDWAFLFSDGYREYDWVRNMGRGGARGLLMLLGGVLVIVGFVGQVVDAASKPVVVTANAQRTSDTPEAPLSPSGSSGATSKGTDQTSRPSPSKGPVVAAPSPGSATSSHASRAPAATVYVPPVAGANQPITIWNPQLEFSEGETMIRLQYRFEPGHEPLPGTEYFWQIEVPAKPTEVAYESLQSEGQLQYILRLAQTEKWLREAWSMVLTAKTDGKRAQVSNRLNIVGDKVQSTPLEVLP